MFRTCNEPQNAPFSREHVCPLGKKMTCHKFCIETFFSLLGSCFALSFPHLISPFLEFHLMWFSSPTGCPKTAWQSAQLKKARVLSLAKAPIILVAPAGA